MTLTTAQVKEAKKLCRGNGIDPRMVNKSIGNGYWEEHCNGTFEGYLADLLKSSRFNGATLTAAFRQSTENYRNGQAGKSSL